MLQEILGYQKINNVKEKIQFPYYKSVQSDKCENNFFDNASLNIGFTMMINPAVRFSYIIKNCWELHEPNHEASNDLGESRDVPIKVSDASL
jgi:hypothetical protein